MPVCLRLQSESQQLAEEEENLKEQMENGQMVRTLHTHTACMYMTARSVDRHKRVSGYVSDKLPPPSSIRQEISRISCLRLVAMNNASALLMQL